MDAVAAVSVVVRRGDCLLLVKRGTPPSRGFYAFPGGRMEEGERPEDAARRELMEETGLTAGPLRFLAVVSLPPAEGRPPYRLTVFLGEDAGGSPRPGDDAAETLFATFDAMRALPLAPHVLDTARLVLS